MGVSPSGVDGRHREKILEQLEADMFYIFMVWNKRLEIHTLIYDMEKNILYEDKDVTVKLLGGEDMDIFLSDAREKVQNKKKKSETKNQEKEQIEFVPDLAEYNYFPYSHFGFNDFYDREGKM